MANGSALVTLGQRPDWNRKPDSQPSAPSGLVGFAEDVLSLLSSVQSDRNWTFHYLTFDGDARNMSHWTEKSSGQSLCKNDLHLELKVECWQSYSGDWERLRCVPWLAVSCSCTALGTCDSPQVQCPPHSPLHVAHIQASQSVLVRTE